MGPGDARKLKDEAAKAVEKGKWKKALEAYSKLELLERTNGSWAHKAGDMHRRLGNTPEAIAAFTRAADAYSGSGFLLKAVAVCKIILELDPAHNTTMEKLAGFHANRTSGTDGLRGGAAAAMLRGELAKPRGQVGGGWAPPPGAAAAASVAAAATLRPTGAAPRTATGSFEIQDIDVEAEAPAVPERTATGSFQIADFDVVESIPAGTPPPPPKRRTLPPGMSLDQVSLASAIPDSRRSQQFAAVNVADIMEIPIDEGDPEIEIDVSAPSAADAARAALPKTPLFSALDEAHLRVLLDGVKLIELEAGQILFRQGDPADALYVVADGEVAVMMGSSQVARLGEGSFFGEIALLTSQPRNATIQATAATNLLAIDRDTISRLVEDSPQVLKVLLRFLRDRLFETLVATNPLFAPFNGPERIDLARRFGLLEADAGALVMTQGHPATGLFIMLSGQAEVVRDGAPVARLAAGDIFGEMSLLHGEPASASVRALSRLYLLQLDRRTFSEVIMTHPQVLELIAGLADNRRTSSAPAAGGAVFEDGHLRLL